MVFSKIQQKLEQYNMVPSKLMTLTMIKIEQILYFYKSKVTQNKFNMQFHKKLIIKSL